MKITDDTSGPAYGHVMIDIETMDTIATAAIVSIGAVCFDPLLGTGGPRFYRAVRLDERQTALGLTTSRDTMDWWDGQPAAARAVFVDPDRVDITDAMLDLRDWLKAARPKHAWSHGASFDLPILQNVARRTFVEFPLDFRDFRDTRTLFDIARTGVNRFRDKATVHNALADAEAQASAVLHAWATL